MTINLTNVAGCVDPRASRLQHRSQLSFEMESWPSASGSFLGKLLADGEQTSNLQGLKREQA